MNSRIVLCNNQLTRRSCIQLGSTVIGLAVCNTLLPACLIKKTAVVTTLPNESPEQFSEEVKQYYKSQSEKLLVQYDTCAVVYKEYLINHYPREKVDDWLQQSRSTYIQLIPNLPYIGGDGNDQTRILLGTSTYIPIIKVLRDTGIEKRKIGHMIVSTAATLYKKEIPWLVKRIISWKIFSESGKQKKRFAAIESQKKQYPADWVFQYVEGDGSSFEYGITYSECALQKFWTIQGLKEYVPYLCLCDYVIWREFGIEVTRTKTLGNGSTECDFKYIRKGTNVPPAWPPESHPEWRG